MRWNRPKKRTIKGLGDVIEVLALPIAKGIDKVFKTNIEGCSSCNKRREKLNELVPFDE